MKGATLEAQGLKNIQPNSDLGNETQGTLALTVIEARLTRDTEAIGKMDPFVRITYNQQ